MNTTNCLGDQEYDALNVFVFSPSKFCQHQIVSNIFFPNIFLQTIFLVQWRVPVDKYLFLWCSVLLIQTCLNV